MASDAGAPRLNAGLFSNRTDEWATPNDLFKAIDDEFHFTIDAAASPDNAKCDRFYTKEQNGLLQTWAGETVWCNPPYSEVAEWIAKAHGEVDAKAIVLLIPARTDTRWFHGYVLGMAEIRFMKGRVKFGGGTSNAPFPSMLVIYRQGDRFRTAQQGLFTEVAR